MDTISIKTYAKITRQGTSLVLALTKDFKKLGLKEGDWVEVTIQKAPQNYEPPIFETKKLQRQYDPSKVGDMIVKSLEFYPDKVPDEEIRKLAETYDGDSSHIELILGYVKNVLKK